MLGYGRLQRPIGPSRGRCATQLPLCALVRIGHQLSACLFILISVLDIDVATIYDILSILSTAVQTITLRSAAHRVTAEERGAYRRMGIVDPG